MQPLNLSIVFGIDQTRAKPDYAVMKLPHEPALKGWGGKKNKVKIRGKLYTVEIFCTLDTHGQQELELKP